MLLLWPLNLRFPNICNLPYRRAYQRYSSHCVEEALANRKAWGWAKGLNRKFNGLEKFAEEFMDSQPNAYSRYCEDPIVLGSELAENLINQNFGKGGASHLADWAIEMPSKFSNRNVPEYLIYDINLNGLYPAVPLPPSVTQIDDSHLLSKRLKKDSRLREVWKKTKGKLLKAARLSGLDFKPWPKGGANVWSVRVNDGDRVHLKQTDSNKGIWEAIDIGTHDQMGH